MGGYGCLFSSFARLCVGLDAYVGRLVCTSLCVSVCLCMYVCTGVSSGECDQQQEGDGLYAMHP